MQVEAVFVEQHGVAVLNQQALAVVDGADLMQRSGQAGFFKGRLNGFDVLARHLYHCAQFFVKQSACGGVLQLVAAALLAGLLNHGRQIQIHAQMRRKAHFRQRGQKAAVAAVVIGQKSALGHQALHYLVKSGQMMAVV